MSHTTWRVRLSDAAETDFDDIVRWIVRRFGRSQASSYAGRLAEALAALEEGPTRVGVHTRDEIAPGLLTLHLGLRARHVIVFKVANTVPATIDVLRILHDAMDIVRHL